MKKNKEKLIKRIIIERIGLDDEGHIVFVDLHDEKFGEAVFIDNASRHFHEFYNDGKYKE